MGFTYSELMTELLDWPFGVNEWSQLFSLAILLIVAYLGESKFFKKHWFGRILRWVTISYVVITIIFAYIELNFTYG